MRIKGQIWGLDIMAGMALFLIGVMIFFIYSINQPSQAEETIDILSYQGKTMSDTLLSEGQPKGWTPNNVIELGLTTNGKINETKLENLYQIIYIDGNYPKTKNILGTEYDYYLTFGENITINSESIEGIGKPNVTTKTIQSKNLIKTTRFTIYQNKTVPFSIYVWEE